MEREIKHKYRRHPLPDDFMEYFGERLIPRRLSVEEIAKKCGGDYAKAKQFCDQYADEKKFKDAMFWHIMINQDAYRKLALLYHMEEACRRMFGKVLQDEEWEEHMNEILSYTEKMLKDAESNQPR